MNYYFVINFSLDKLFLVWIIRISFYCLYIFNNFFDKIVFDKSCLLLKHDLIAN